MNDRERREFEAGLSAEVDAWLRGDNTRRDFIKKFGLMAGLLATSVKPSGISSNNAVIGWAKRSSIKYSSSEGESFDCTLIAIR